MNTIVKIAIGAGAIGAIFWGVTAAQKALKDFQFDLVGYGKPTIKNLMLTVPLQIRFKNPTPIPISIDQLIADIFLLKGSEFVPAAKINQPVVIEPGESFQVITPVLNLQAVFGGNIFDTLKAAAIIAANRTVTLRTDVIAIYKGVSLPDQSITNTLTF